MGRERADDLTMDDWSIRSWTKQLWSSKGKPIWLRASMSRNQCNRRRRGKRTAIRSVHLSFPRFDATASWSRSLLWSVRSGALLVVHHSSPCRISEPEDVLECFVCGQRPTELGLHGKLCDIGPAYERTSNGRQTTANPIT